jgi:cytochrome P450
LIPKAGVPKNDVTANTLKTAQSQAFKAPPKYPAYPIVGVSRIFRRDPLGLLERAMRGYGDIVHLSFGPTRVILLTHPDYIQQVLQTNNRNYDRKTYGNRIVQIVSGLNLLTSDGEYWLNQRRLMQPAFHRQRIAAFGELMTGVTGRMLAAWESGGGEVDAQYEMMQLTLEIVGRSLFQVDLTSDANLLGESFLEGMSYVNYRLNTLLFAPLWIPTVRNRRLKKSLRDVDEILYGMIDERRRDGEDRGDFLSMLLQARYEDTGESMTDEQLKNEIGIMLGAGHETTANALAWTFYLLSVNSSVETELHREVDAVLGDRVPTVDDLADLPYTRMVIEEALRLYPPAWTLAGRRAIEDDAIDGYRIPAGSLVLIVPYVVHRNPQFWPDPERFDPLRFTPEMEAARPRFAYIPFGGGPRLCIGNLFAMTEAQLILAMIAQRYSLRLKPGYKVVPDPIFTLRVHSGLPMTLTPRDKTYTSREPARPGREP